jgi:DNA gyrase subunit A
LAEEEMAEEAEGEGAETSSQARYRAQRRGGKGLRDIKTKPRNGRVIGIARVDDSDELLMMTARGKIQRIAAREISVVGRNTQGVRIMSLDEGDALAAIVPVPKEEEGEGEEPAAPSPEAHE